MDSNTLRSLTTEIARRYPEIAGCRPTVQARPAGQVMLVFRATRTTADGRSIARVVRALVSASGQVLKVTTSK